MRRATRVEQGHADGEITVTLAYDARHRRRIRMTDDGGEAFLLDLAEAVMLKHHDRLLLEDGGVITVKAAAEPVADLHCNYPVQAARIAWHIGNRHTAIQILSDGVLRIAADHVLAAMAEGLGARVEHLNAPFAPEAGAYSGGAHSHEGNGHGGHSHEGHGHEGHGHEH